MAVNQREAANCFGSPHTRLTNTRIADTCLYQCVSLRRVFNLVSNPGLKETPMASSDKIRVQFDFSQEAYQELNDIQNAADASTKAEAVRYGLRTLQWLLSQIKAGRRILVDDNGAVQEVVFPFLTRSGPSK